MSRRPPRIALIAPALELAQWWGPVLAALGAHAEVHLYTGQAWAGLERDPVRDRVTVVGRTGRVGGVSADGAYSGVMRPSLRVLPALWSFRPDVVIAQGFSLWTIAVLLVRPLARWRVVVLWEGSTPSVDRRGSRLHTTLRRALGGAADWLMTSNERSRAYLTDHLRLPGDRILVHPYLVGSPYAMLADGGGTPELDGCARPLLLHVGRLEPRKGLAELFAALALLDDALPWSLALVGKGPQEAELRDAARRLGLDDRIHWLGWRDYGRVGAYLEAADLLVFPTLEDTWGMVVVEAMAHGRPVACSVAAGASELITDGVEGILVDPRDQADMAARLGDLLRGADLPAMGRAAARTAGRLRPDVAAAALWRAAAAASGRGGGV